MTITLGAHLFTADEAARFRAKFAPGVGPDDCWWWTASLRTTGYGQFYFRGRPYAAHRLAYLHFWGPFPEGKPHVMHSCDNRPCVNPFHLAAGSNRDNVADRELKARNRIGPAHAVAYANRAARTHCWNGHEYTAENTRLRFQKNRPGPSRVCLACKRESYKR